MEVNSSLYLANLIFAKLMIQYELAGLEKIVTSLMYLYIEIYLYL